MLVDDSATDNMVADILFRKLEIAKRVLTCTSASAALSYLAKWDGIENRSVAGLPELILLDLYMPVTDGFEFLNRLAQLSLPLNPAVYILTASISPVDRERAGSYGSVKGFLVKPLTEKILRKL